MSILAQSSKKVLKIYVDMGLNYAKSCTRLTPGTNKKKIL